MLNLAKHKSFYSKTALSKAIALAIVSLLVGCQTPEGAKEQGNSGSTSLNDQGALEQSPSVPVTPSPSLPVTQSPSPPVTQSPSIPLPPPPTPPTPPTPPPVSQSPSQPITITPATEGCKITMAIVSDPNPPLNVRSAPMVAEGNIVGKVDNGTYVTVTEEQNGWLRIDEPAGWISKQNTQTTCAQVTERINFAPNGNSAIIKGRIIGPGSHKYILSASAGQTIKVIKLNPEGVFPAIIDPDGNILAGNPYTDADRNEWTGALPVTGDYSLQMDSNFRGFDYQFSVEVK
ncbi:MAG: hypothetical protein Fur0025_25310 [Oscillatoriaceae cyanobacterium]